MFSVMSAPVWYAQAFAFSDGSDKAGAATAALWCQAYPSEPFHPRAWKSDGQASGATLQLTLQLWLFGMPVSLHQLLRASYMQLPFLERAVDR